jgi:hypothetical protein
MHSTQAEFYSFRTKIILGWKGAGNVYERASPGMSRCSMKSTFKYVATAICLLWASAAKAQSAGVVECARGDGYVYLYSSMTTLDVRTTLQCGEQVQITGRYDTFFGVRTQKGEVGYLAVASLLLLKDNAGPAAPPPAAVRPARPRTAYDPAEQPDASPKSHPVSAELILANGTPIHLKLSKTLSSATAKVGDIVELEVTEDVTVDELTVIPRGAVASAMVKEAEPKKHLGHGGKLGFLVYSVRLGDDEKAPARSYQEGTGTNNSVGSVLPMASGKDIVFPQGMEFTAYIDGDMHLKREAFISGKGNTKPAATSATAQKPSQPHP